LSGLGEHALDEISEILREGLLRCLFPSEEENSQQSVLSITFHAIVFFFDYSRRKNRKEATTC
jgi:hypothetical protein